MEFGLRDEEIMRKESQAFTEPTIPSYEDKVRLEAQLPVSDSPQRRRCQMSAMFILYVLSIAVWFQGLRRAI